MLNRIIPGARRVAITLSACLAFAACNTVAGPDEGSGAPPPPPVGCLPPASCDTPVGPGVTPGITPASVFTAMNVSAPSAGAVVTPSPSGGVVYASLPSGTVTEGVSLNIVNHRTGERVSAPIVSGGVDPVAIPAVAGDTLGFIVISAQGQAVAREKIKVVPANQPPIVVRTEPIQGKQDVPLNARILVVFSEPIDPGTLTDGSLQLQTGGVAVAGTVAFDDPEHLRATFTPTAPLLPEVDYTLVVAGTIQNVAGNPLIAPAPVTFTSGAAPMVSVYTRVTPDPVSNVPSFFILSPDGTFALRYVDTNSVSGFYDYVGSYDIAATTHVVFLFDAIDRGPPWIATATRNGSSITVTFNGIMGLAGFEDGTYTLTDGPGLP